MPDKKFIYILLMPLLFVSGSLKVFSAQSEFKPSFYQKMQKRSGVELMRAAYKYYDMDKKDSATICWTIVANRYNQNTDNAKNLSMCLVAMGNLRFMYSYTYFDYQKAYYYINKVIKLYDQYEVGNQFDIAFAYNSLGGIYASAYNIRPVRTYALQAMKYYKQGMLRALKGKDFYNYDLLAFNLCEMAFVINDYSLIAKDMIAYRRYCNRKSALNEIVLLYDNANKAHSLGRDSQALYFLDEITKDKNKKKLPPDVIITIRQIMAHIYEKQGLYTKALDIYRQTLAMAQKNKYQDILASTYNKMSNCYSSQDNHAEAQRYRIHYLELKDSLSMICNIEQAYQMQFLNDINEANENMQELQRQQHLRDIFLFLACCIIIVISALLLVIWRINHRLRRSNEQLYKQAMERISPPKTSIVSDIPYDDIFSKVKTFVSSSDEIFSNDFSLHRLAKLVDINYKYVSQAINQKSGKNFNAFINEYRIEEACRRLNDQDNYGKLTVEAIGVGLGFKSRSNFESTFRKVTGLTPAVFRKIAFEKNVTLY